jgi:tellurite resistance protein TerC
MDNTLFFSLFTISIVAILVFDLVFVGKNKHIISLKESAIWTSVWVALAVGFYFIIMNMGEQIHSINSLADLMEYKNKYAPHLLVTDNLQESLAIYRKGIATDYITGYLLEYTLSIDNVFVIMMILASFSVDLKNYKQVLFWGILGAIILRFFFIFAGSALIQKFTWILLVFGAFLIYTGIKMFIDRNKDEKIDVKEHWLVKFLSRHFNITPNFEKHHFFVRQNRKLFITPLFVVLILIEFTDLIFAFDSIPAIFSITRDPYIVFFSNIFAIIGLRSLFFLLIKIIEYFHYIKVGVAFLLAFVGIKLIFHEFLVEIGFKNVYSLYIILFTLLISILASVVFPQKQKVETN